MQPQRAHDPQVENHCPTVVGKQSTISPQQQRRDIDTSFVSPAQHLPALPHRERLGLVSLHGVFPLESFFGGCLLPMSMAHSFPSENTMTSWLLREPPDEMGHGLREVCAPEARLCQGPP